MQATTLHSGASLAVYDFRCDAKPSDRPFPEVHKWHSVSYVRRGSFGCRTLGRAYDLVAGSVMVGRPGQEYMATHEHHACGDECLSVKLEPALAEEFPAAAWDVARLPPLPELMVLGELAQAAAAGRASVALDEAAMLLVGRFAAVASQTKDSPFKTSSRERRKAVDVALWLEENAAEPVGLADAARQAALSPYHFLRIFKSVTGVTPHQYLLRLRLRKAARLLAAGGMPVTEVALESGFADLSNFVRTFRRAAGVPPARFSKKGPPPGARLAACSITSA